MATSAPQNARVGELGGPAPPGVCPSVRPAARAAQPLDSLSPGRRPECVTRSPAPRPVARGSGPGPNPLAGGFRFICDYRRRRERRPRSAGTPASWRVSGTKHRPGIGARPPVPLLGLPLRCRAPSWEAAGPATQDLGRVLPARGGTRCRPRPHGSRGAERPALRRDAEGDVAVRGPLASRASPQEGAAQTPRPRPLPRTAARTPAVCEEAPRPCPTNLPPAPRRLQAAGESCRAWGTAPRPPAAESSAGDSPPRPLGHAHPPLLFSAYRFHAHLFKAS